MFSNFGYFERSGGAIRSNPVEVGVAGATTGADSGGFEHAVSNTRNTKMTAGGAVIGSTVARTYFLRSLLSPHRALAVKYGFECGLRVLRQMVRLAIVRKLVRGNVSLERQHRIRDQRGRVPIAADKFCRMPKRQVDQIVEDQHLAIAIRASADANRRRFDFRGDHGRHLAR